jgi:hypothetical protein
MKKKRLAGEGDGLKDFTTRVPADLLTRLGHCSVDAQKSIQALVAEAIADLLKKRGA